MRRVTTLDLLQSPAAVRPAASPVDLSVRYPNWQNAQLTIPDIGPLALWVNKELQAKIERDEAEDRRMAQERFLQIDTEAKKAGQQWKDFLRANPAVPEGAGPIYRQEVYKMLGDRLAREASNGYERSFGELTSIRGTNAAGADYGTAYTNAEKDYENHPVLQVQEARDAWRARLLVARTEFERRVESTRSKAFEAENAEGVQNRFSEAVLRFANADTWDQGTIDTFEGVMQQIHDEAKSYSISDVRKFAIGGIRNALVTIDKNRALSVIAHIWDRKVGKALPIFAKDVESRAALETLTTQLRNARDEDERREIRDWNEKRQIAGMAVHKEWASQLKDAFDAGALDRKTVDAENWIDEQIEPEFRGDAKRELTAIRNAIVSDSEDDALRSSEFIAQADRGELSFSDAVHLLDSHQIGVRTYLQIREGIERASDTEKALAGGGYPRVRAELEQFVRGETAGVSRETQELIESSASKILDDLRGSARTLATSGAPDREEKIKAMLAAADAPTRQKIRDRAKQIEDERAERLPSLERKAALGVSVEKEARAMRQQGLLTETEALMLTERSKQNGVTPQVVESVRREIREALPAALGRMAVDARMQAIIAQEYQALSTAKSAKERAEIQASIEGLLQQAASPEMAGGGVRPLQPTPDQILVATQAAMAAYQRFLEDAAEPSIMSDTDALLLRIRAQDTAASAGIAAVLSGGDTGTGAEAQAAPGGAQEPGAGQEAKKPEGGQPAGAAPKPAASQRQAQADFQPVEQAGLPPTFSRYREFVDTSRARYSTSKGKPTAGEVLASMASKRLGEGAGTNSPTPRADQAWSLAPAWLFDSNLWPGQEGYLGPDRWQGRANSVRAAQEILDRPSSDPGLSAQAALNAMSLTGLGGPAAIVAGEIPVENTPALQAALEERLTAAKTKLGLSNSQTQYLAARTQRRAVPLQGLEIDPFSMDLGFRDEGELLEWMNNAERRRALFAALKLSPEDRNVVSAVGNAQLDFLRLNRPSGAALDFPAERMRGYSQAFDAPTRALREYLLGVPTPR